MSRLNHTIKLKTVSAHIVFPVLRLIGLLTRRFNYRGLGRAAILLGHVFPPAMVDVRLSPNTTIEIDLFDDYWLRLIVGNSLYEPEIEAFLDKLPPDYYWVDCGANIGYWSLRLSERLPGGHVVAVEASPDTFKRLVTNNRLSGERFRAINKALSESPGEEVLFKTSGGHASAHIVSTSEAAGDQATLVNVETTTVDELVRSLSPRPEKDLVVVKLDVEGAECAAIRGAEASINRFNVIFIYECHGNDLQCVTTQHVLEDGRFDVYSLEGKITPVTSLHDAQAIKKDPRKGYNFVAIKKSSTLKLAEKKGWAGSSHFSIVSSFSCAREGASRAQERA